MRCRPDSVVRSWYDAGVPYPSRIDAEALGRDALAVVEASGWEGWSLRDVARALGVSANALYRHVADRDDLMVAMGEAAAEQLRTAMTPDKSTPGDELVEMARRYVDFAMQRPAAFSAFCQAKPEPDHPRAGAWLRLWLDVCDRIQPVLPNAVDAAAFAFWSLVHGRAELLRGPARHLDPTAGLAVAVTALIEGFAHRGPVPSPLPAKVRRALDHAAAALRKG